MEKPQQSEGKPENVFIVHDIITFFLHGGIAVDPSVVYMAALKSNRREIYAADGTIH